MFYTMEQLKRKLKRSQPFVRMCIDRFGIKQTRLKTTRELVYDVPAEKMKEIIEFSFMRQTRGRKNRN